MEFRTIVPIEKNVLQIDYNSKIVSFGSCFASNMASKFDFYKFENLCNPFGIIFNIVSIEKIVNRIANLDYFTADDVFQNNGLWHCYEAHSCLSNANKYEFIDNLNQKLVESHLYLKSATTFIITLGTSWVYELKQSKTVVANCHKMPQKLFVKSLLTSEESAISLRNILTKIQEINPNVKFTCTISPVRHTKDGFYENNVSKSHLFTAIYGVTNTKLATYFPSYEIIMDELRDYRFYASDLLHPNETAINYIWERFTATQLLEETSDTINNVESIQKMLLHRHQNTHSFDYEVFNKKLIAKIAKLQGIYPMIKF